MCCMTLTRGVCWLIFWKNYFLWGFDHIQVKVKFTFKFSFYSQFFFPDILFCLLNGSSLDKLFYLPSRKHFISESPLTTFAGQTLRDSIHFHQSYFAGEIFLHLSPDLGIFFCWSGEIFLLIVGHWGSLQFSKIYCPLIRDTEYWQINKISFRYT